MHNITRALRKEKGLQQQQMADYLHLDRSTYAYYESGRSKLNADIIVKLAHFYQVRYAVLLGEEPGQEERGEEKHPQICECAGD